ncbi:ribonuclease H protein, partial [Trifolium medium]|nr:ribonuclease H protein [Trifolium medium]
MVFNLSLLAKWRWRLLVEDKSQWKLALEAIYGDIGRPSLSFGRSKKTSIWWRDLVGLGVLRGVDGDWLEDSFVQKIGDGGDANFWHGNWCVLGPLVKAFPRLFSISLQSEACIKEMGVWMSGVWIWQLKWRRPFFIWEEELYRDFLRLLEEVHITLEKPSWSYRHDDGGIYSVKANYIFLASKMAPLSSLSPSHCDVLHKVWDSWAPSKVVVFSWQTLLSRIPTRYNLAKRGVMLDDDHLRCAVCGGGVESENHLFVLCPLAS